MIERINYNNGYYYGDVTTKYINGSFMKVKHGFGTYYWNSGERLEATYMDDSPLNGKYYFKDGTIYDGSFQNWNFHGFGSMKWPNGDLYVGNFVNGSRSGKGRYTFASGGYYDGDWFNGNRHGQGENVYSDNVKYVGTYLNDKRDGYGVQEYTNGWVYKGYFKEDKINGQGEYSHKTNGYYKGNFIDGVRTGYGIGIYPNENYQCPFKYLGNWQKDLHHGQGSYFGYGYRYDGEFSEGYFQGIGILYFSEDPIDFSDDIDEVERYDFKNNFAYRYVGSFSKSRFNGQGTLTFNYDQIILSGTWIDGRLSGTATKMISADGFRLKGKTPRYDVYEGICVDNKFFGAVKVTRADGTVDTVSSSDAEKLFEEEWNYYLENEF